MSAVAERQAPAQARSPSARRTLPATAVEPLRDREQLGQIRGIHLLQTHSCLFGGFIDAHDVIEVDFDIRRIKCDAEYLIAYHSSDDYTWFGVRRFQYRLDGELWIADPEYPNGLAWRRLTPAALHNIEVFGMVREVYKPYSKTRFRNG